MPIYVAAILGAIAAVACTVLSVIFIMPEKKRPTLNKFFAAVHDLFNFKYLVLEKILKILYVFSTLYCVGFGFFGLFSGTYYGGGFYSRGHFSSFALQGILILILGPIVVRIVYESVMMFILLVKNTIEINKKMPGEEKPEMEDVSQTPPTPSAPMTPPAQQPNAPYQNPNWPAQQ